tara:strand:- start:1338 stop:2417 length:1080 start_codon:yes stop_codon:yes gene_type:complete
MDFVTPFSGSYEHKDVLFLLTQVDVEITPIDLKEAMIQSGEKHYSEMISREAEPSEFHLEIYEKSLTSNGRRLASNVVTLARSLAAQLSDTPIVLVSLVRAGVPLGVMLHQTLTKRGVKSHHYGVSIIRDRGLDEAALNYIEAKHGTKGVVFVDGWTGKGAISNELMSSLKGRSGYPEKPRLVVLADLCGRAWMSASNEDWLIPFGIMGAPVSGLVSRSIWSESGAHGCILCDHLLAYDRSQELVKKVGDLVDKLDWSNFPCVATNTLNTSTLRSESESVVTRIANEYHITNTNRIKPGIAEATRAVLRRIPEHVLVRSKKDPDVALLVHLANEKKVNVVEVGDTIGQYRAVTIIKKVI